MRHGIASERAEGQEDAERTLSRRGCKQTESAARGLGRLCGRVEIIATSPLTRALQTAQILDEKLKFEVTVQVWPELALLLEEGADLEPIQARIRASTSTCILLVGHQPGCSRLLSLLLCAKADVIELDWKKAGVACLEIEDERAALIWFATPRILRNIARRPGQ